MSYQPGAAYSPPPKPYRRWPIAVAGAASGAVITALVAALIVGQRQAEPATKPTAPATVTVTATPAPPPLPTPLPAAQADRLTCNAWLAAGDKIHAATASLAVIPKGTTIVDQAVRDNPDWSAAVRAAADLYGQAGAVLAAGIAPGTTAILSETASVASAALRALSTAETTLDATNGNAYDAAHDTGDTMDVLCERLAPK